MSRTPTFLIGSMIAALFLSLAPVHADQPEEAGEPLPEVTHPPVSPAEEARATQYISRGAQLTEEEADELEDALEESPDELRHRIKLLSHYFRSGPHRSAYRERRVRHALWIIEHHPEHAIHTTPLAEVDAILQQDAFREAAAMWEGHLEDEPGHLAVITNAARFYLMHERERALELFSKASRMDEDEPARWHLKIAQVHDLNSGWRRGEDAETAQRAVDAYRSAFESLTATERSATLGSAAHAAVRADQLAQAEEWAKELLEQTERGPRDWNYGNAVHHGNLVLGRVALAAGEVDEAERRLLRAAETPGSPQLDSFGPNMTLAQELLEADRREVVVDYLKKCREFWQDDKTRDWIAAIEAGESPGFGANLRY